MFKEDAANKTGESLKGNSASVELCGYGGKEQRVGQSYPSPFINCSRCKTTSLQSASRSFTTIMYILPCQWAKYYFTSI